MPPAPVPPTVPAGQFVYEFAVLGAMVGQAIINTFHYIITDSVITPGEPTQVANAFWDYVKATWMAAVSSDYSVKSVTARVVGFPTIPSETVEIGAANVGTQEGQAAPPTVAAVIRRRSYFGGKRGRGRFYLAGVPNDWIHNGMLDLTYIGTSLSPFTERLDDVIPVGDTGEMRPFHWSRNLPLETGVRGAEIISIAIDPILGTQRRRRVGVGI